MSKGQPRSSPEKEREYAERYAEKHPDRRLWQVAKQRARKYGIEFNIEVSDIFVPMYCPVFGFKLVTGTGHSGRQGGNTNSPSLDRIDPTKGYVKGNIQVISHLANSMKHQATAEQLQQFAKWILTNAR